ncbi:MAG TPA: CPBP family glutamic-type intramembrane protease [Flavobacteriales bacterium]|nr:CPBP family glutamic-type intramembrane protease [Flavobacteriales bacterium]
MSTQRRIFLFLFLAFGISWAIAGVGALVGVDTEHPAYVALAASCMLGPALAAIIQWKLIERAPWSALALHPKLIRWRGLVITIFIALCIVPLALLVARAGGEVFHVEAFGNVEVSGDRFSASIQEILAERGVTNVSSATHQLAALPGVIILLVLAFSAVFAAFTVNLPFMLGEELGWRGFLFAATAHWAPAQRIALTGPVWGLWHAPLILLGHNYPDHPYAGIVMMMVFCTVLAVLFDHARLRSNSVWAPCVLHGIINGTAGAFALFSTGGHVLVGSPAGLTGVIAITLIALAILLVDQDYRRTFFTTANVPAS